MASLAGVQAAVAGVEHLHVGAVAHKPSYHHIQEAIDVIQGAADAAVVKQDKNMAAKAAGTDVAPDDLKFKSKSSAGMYSFGVVEGKVVLLLGQKEKDKQWYGMSGNVDKKDMGHANPTVVVACDREANEESNGAYALGETAALIAQESTVFLPNNSWKMFFNAAIFAVYDANIAQRVESFNKEVAAGRTNKEIQAVRLFDMSQVLPALEAHKAVLDDVKSKQEDRAVKVDGETISGQVTATLWCAPHGNFAKVQAFVKSLTPKAAE